MILSNDFKKMTNNYSNYYFCKKGNDKDYDITIKSTF